MNRPHHIISLLLFLAAAVADAQHTPITSQYLFNGLLINPAYAGSRDALTANLTHRQQWVGFDGAPTTQLLSVHSPVAVRKLGLGIMIFNDRIGASHSSGIMGSFAYRLKLPKGTMSFGLGGGLSAVRTDWSSLAVQERNDLSFQQMDRSGMVPDLSAGLFYHDDRSFAGLSLPFLLDRDAMQPSEVRGTYTRIVNMRPMLFVGRILTLNRELKLKPTALARYTVAGGMQGDVSTNLIINEVLWLGVSYRTNDALVGMLEVLPTPQWRLGYSYDIGLSSFGRYHHGSHEIMVQYEFGYRLNVRDPRYF